MDIVCSHCKGKFKVADEKVPVGKTVSMPCPKCKNKLSISADQKSNTDPSKEALVDGDAHTEAYDTSDKPFDFVEEELKSALICESDATVRKALISALSNMEYHVTVAKDTRDALRKMRYHVYDLVMVNEAFDKLDSDQSGVLGYLERLPMEIRRRTFVTLVSQRYRTMDNMMTFNRSVNLIINTKNIEDVEKILTRRITDNDFFYRVLNDSLRAAGRIRAK
jgi:ActR/RegA family two-component response regulator